MFSIQVTDAPSQGKARDSGGWDDSPRRGEAERLSFVIEVAPRGSAFGTCRTIGRTHANSLHGGQVDHQAVIAYGVARHAVATAADGHPQVALTSNSDGRDHVPDSRTPHDQRRSLVDHSIEDLAGILVAGMPWLNELSLQICPES